jgi:hypothetical protein
MPRWVRDAGVWKPEKTEYVRDAGVWKPAREQFVRDAGVWKPYGITITSTDFSEYPDDQFPSGWSEPWAAGAWQVVDPDQLRDDSMATAQKLIVWDNAPVAIQGQYLAMVAAGSYTDNFTGAPTVAAGGATGSRRGAALGLYAGAGNILVGTWENDSWSGANYQTGTPWAASTWYWVRFYYTATQYKFAIYDVSQALITEQTSWVNWPGGRVLQQSGKIGIYNTTSAYAWANIVRWSPWVDVEIPFI